MLAVVSDVIAVVAVLVLAGLAVQMVRRRRHGLVAERGMSVGADLGTLSDRPRVRVREVTTMGPERVRLVLTPEADPAADMDLVVSLREDEFGFDLLHEWRRSGAPVAIVFPPGSHLVRLRGVDDLQPLTLRRADGE